MSKYVTEDPTEAVCRNCLGPLILNQGGEWVHKETYSPKCVRYSLESKFTDPIFGICLVTKEFEASGDDKYYCMGCGKELQIGVRPGGTFLIKCKCRKPPMTVVPDGVVFTFEERETINLKKIKNAQKYQYITVCNLCNRPVHNREDARWRCLICGNRFKDKRTTFKIQKGLIYTWTEQRQETE